MLRGVFRSYFVIWLLVFFSACKSREKSIAGSPGPKADQSKNKKTISAPPELIQKLGISKKEVRESPFYSFISEWYGTPYRYGGCKPSGVDCSCFANLLYEKVYDRKIGRSAGDIYKACKKISLKDAKEGDLLFFRINGDTISHVGVYLGKSYFVHSSTSKGVIISSMEEAYYKKTFYCAGKLRHP